MDLHDRFIAIGEKNCVFLYILLETHPFLFLHRGDLPGDDQIFTLRSTRRWPVVNGHCALRILLTPSNGYGQQAGEKEGQSN